MVSQQIDSQLLVYAQKLHRPLNRTAHRLLLIIVQTCNIKDTNLFSLSIRTPDDIACPCTLAQLLGT